MSKSGVILISLAVSAIGSAQTISVYVNGDPVQFSGVTPQRIDGRVLVPLRGVMEKLGAYVSYQAATKTVTANRGDVDLQLTLGQRRAVLNGREVMLDVPAMEYRGSTLVPLRFMSEALGADVKWDPVAFSVQISTSGSQPPTDPNNPPTGTAIEISGFDVTAPSVLRAGSDIEFRLTGTPGGTASVQIPGVVRDLALRETSRGIYTGSYTIPNNSSSAITVGKATAIARLKVGRDERLIQAATTMQVDNQPPAISSATPENNGRVNNLRPNITAVFEDTSGSGIDASTIRMSLDGRDVTNDATVTENLIAYKPSQQLTANRHTVEVEVRDKAGNRTVKTWSFNIVDRATVITSFTHNAPKSIQAGDEITFTMVGEAGSDVKLQIGELRTVAMEETSPGKYVGTYVVRRADRLDGIVATARMKTKAGETFSSDVALGSKVSSNQPLSVPTVTSHENNAKVERKEIFKGKADPNSRVLVRIEFTQRVLGAIPMNGSIGEVEVEADAKGNWVTREIDLDTGLGRTNITYTVTVVTLGEDDKRSEATKITLKR